MGELYPFLEKGSRLSERTLVALSTTSYLLNFKKDQKIPGIFIFLFFLFKIIKLQHRQITRHDTWDADGQQTQVTQT